MSKAWVIASKLYWSVVALLPFYPAYRLFSLQEKLACAYGTPCFEHGLPFQVEGVLAGITIGIVLWRYSSLAFMYMAFVWEAFMGLV